MNPKQLRVNDLFANDVEHPKCTNKKKIRLKIAGYFLKNRIDVGKESEAQMTDHIKTNTFEWR